MWGEAQPGPRPPRGQDEAPGVQVNRYVWLVNILFGYFGSFCVALMPASHPRLNGSGGPVAPPPTPATGFYRAGAVGIGHHLVCVPSMSCRGSGSSCWGTPGVLGPGLDGHLPHYVPDPGHEGGHLRVHVGGLGVPAPEAGEGDEAVSPVPAHQGPPRVRLGWRERPGQGSFSQPQLL